MSTNTESKLLSNDLMLLLKIIQFEKNYCYITVALEYFSTILFVPKILTFLTLTKFRNEIGHIQCSTAIYRQKKEINWKYNHV